MGHVLQIYTVLFCVLSLVNGDYRNEGLRDFQKRSPVMPVRDDIDYTMNINSKVISHFAHTVVMGNVVNRGTFPKEAFFTVELPKLSFVTNFSIIIDGVTHVGVIKDKEVAKLQNTGKRAAGLISSSRQREETFTASVILAPKSGAIFELVYEELLKQHFGKYDLFIKVRPKAPFKYFQLVVDIHEPQGISFLDAQATNDLLPAFKKYFSGEKGHASFKRSYPDYATTLIGDFTVTYNIKRQSPGNIQVANGYFVHFFAPTKLPVVPKNVIYVINKHLSYRYGIHQMQGILIKILNDTSKHDHFNVLLFHDDSEVWKDSFMKATPENIKEAQQFTKSFGYHSYPTTLHDPIPLAVELLNKGHGSKEVSERSVSYIILMTDNRNYFENTEIQKNVKKAIQGKYILYCLDLSSGYFHSLVEKMALENSGAAWRFGYDTDRFMQLQEIVKDIANPTLLDIKMQYPENATADLTQNSFRQYLDGEEIVVAGRLTDNNLDSFIVDVKAEGADKTLKYTENVTLQEKDGLRKSKEDTFGDSTRRLWAYLTIQQLLEKRIYADPSEKVHLTAQAVHLSLEFNFVTPVTTMIINKPMEIQLPINMLFVDKFGSDDYTSYYHLSYWADSDPHFVINVLHKDALCFNIQEEPGVVLNLIKDKELGIAVNGELIGNKKTGNNLSNETYFGRLGIVNTEKGLRIEVTPEIITIQNGNNMEMFTWGEITSVNKDGFSLVISKEKNVTFSFGEGATFVIILHKVWKNHPLHRDFLGFYTLDDYKFSAGVHGLIGQFFHGINYEIYNVSKTDKPGKLDATMEVKNKLLTVTRGVQKDYRKDPRNIPCWFVHSNGKGLLDGSHKDYIVPDIFSIA